ncbi:YchJ family metal-binding protein [Rheinheimera gaetbuli]
MRSRYSAYCLRDIDYIYNTYHSSSRVDNPKVALAAFADNSHFIALKVQSCEQSNMQGYVSFNVRYIQQNMLYELTERSRFVYEDAWYYVDGVITDTAPVKILRNALCPCSSGKKFKQCNPHRLSGS